MCFVELRRYVSDLLDSSRCHLAATDPTAYHPTSSIQAHLRSQRQLLSEYATSFRAQEEVQGRRRDAAEVRIFSLGSLVVVKGWYKERLHHSPLVGFLLICISYIIGVSTSWNVWIFMDSFPRWLCRGWKSNEWNWNERSKKPKMLWNSWELKLQLLNTVSCDSIGMLFLIVSRVCMDSQMFLFCQGCSQTVCIEAVSISSIFSKTTATSKDSFFSTRCTSRVSIMQQITTYERHEGISTFVVPPCRTLWCPWYGNFCSLHFSTSAAVRSAFVCFAVGGAIREGPIGARVHEEGVGTSRRKTEGSLRFDPWSQFEAFCCKMMQVFVGFFMLETQGLHHQVGCTLIYSDYYSMYFLRLLEFKKKPIVTANSTLDFTNKILPISPGLPSFFIQFLLSLRFVQERHQEGASATSRNGVPQDEGHSPRPFPC